MSFTAAPDDRRTSTAHASVIDPKSAPGKIARTWTFLVVLEACCSGASMMLALGYLAGRDAFGHGRQLFGAALFLLLAVLIPCVAFSTYRRGGRRGMHRVALRRRTAMTTLGMVYTSAIIVAVVTTYSAQPLLH